jgi:hypothetical protein
MFAFLGNLYRRWRFVEEDLAPAQVAGVPGAKDARRRLEETIAREERQIADFRRNGCEGLARSREGTLRHLHARLRALK